MAKAELTLFSHEILGPGWARGRRTTRSAAAGQARPDARVGRREPVLHRAKATREARLPVRPKEPGRTRQRTVYTLTDKGLRALREYSRTPSTSHRSRASRSSAY